MTKTICICDVTGEEGACIFTYPTGKTQVDPASGNTEYVDRSIDLSHKGAMIILHAVAALFDARNSTYAISRDNFATIMDRAREGGVKEYLATFKGGS